MQFLEIIKLFLKLYPILKELIEKASDKALDIRISINNGKIEAVFNDKNASAKDKANRLNDIFRG